MKIVTRDAIKDFSNYLSSVFILTIDSLLDCSGLCFIGNIPGGAPLLKYHTHKNKEVSKRAVAFKNASLGDFGISHHLLNLYCTWK